MKPAPTVITAGIHTGLKTAGRFAAFLLGWLATGLPASAADASTIHIYAAASLQAALDEVASAYEPADGVRIVGVYASSGGLARQIERGAPADIFISANARWMDYLHTQGSLEPQTRRDLLGNQLAVVHSPCTDWPAGSGLARMLTARPQARIAMGNPDSVPAGAYARQALTHLGLWTEVEPRAVFAENVRAALAWVARCEADFGVVYVTDAVAGETLGIGLAEVLPSESHDRITYPMAVVAGRDSPAVRRFAKYLTGEDAFPLFEKFAFRRVGTR